MVGMVIRGWLLLGDGNAARTLVTSAALVGPLPVWNLPPAGSVEPGRWIVYDQDRQMGPPDPGRLQTFVCVEIPVGPFGA